MTRLAIVVAIVVVMLGVLDTAYLRPQRVHRQWYNRVRVDLESLQHRRPASVDRREWAYMVGWTVNAHGNCCSAPSFINPALRDRFADDLAQNLRGEVGIATIDWIWDEFMKLSRVQSYNQFRPTTPEHLREAANFAWAGVAVE